MQATKSVRQRLHDQHTALRARWVRGVWSLAAYEFLSFGIKQAWACLFGGAMVFLLFATYLFYPAEAALTGASDASAFPNASLALLRSASKLLATSVSFGISGPAALDNFSLA